MSTTLTMEKLYETLESQNRILLEMCEARAEAGDLAMRREVNVHLGMIVEDNAANRMSESLLRAYISGARELQRKYQ